MRRSSSVLSRKVLSKERREMSARAKAWRPDYLKVKKDCVFFDIREKGCYMFSLAFACKITSGEFKKRNLPALAPPRALCFII